MPHQNATFFQKPPCISANKLASNALFKLGIFLTLTAVVQISEWSKPVRAGDLDRDSHLRQKADFLPDSNFLKSSKNSTFLPTWFNSLAFSVKSQAVEASEPRSPATESNLQARSEQHIHAIESPSYYTVEQGDTIYKIANQHQVSAQELIELNQIRNPNSIFVNQRLEIPHSHGGAIADSIVDKSQVGSAKTSQALTSSKPDASGTSVEEDPYITKLKAEIDELRAQYKPEKSPQNSSSTLISAVDRETQLEKSNSSVSATASLTPPSELNIDINASEADTIALTLPSLIDDEYLPEAFDGYTWPAEGVLTSGYGWRWGRIHRGIDIAAPIGTPIVAAAAGKVIGAGWHSGYGNLIKLEHLDGSITYYAHLNRILVTHGQQVGQGEQIAEMGSTGYSTGSHLHFEIHLRDRTIANPLALLGSR